MTAKRLKTRQELRAEADLDEHRRELITQAQDLEAYFGFCERPTAHNGRVLIPRSDSGDGNSNEPSPDVSSSSRTTKAGVGNYEATRQRPSTIGSTN